MENIVSLIAAFGIGSMVTAVVQTFLSAKTADKRLIFDERKEAYIGLLASWRDQDIEGANEQNRYHVGHWLLRCQLVASNELNAALARWQNTEPGSPKRKDATESVKALMRKDLIGKIETVR